MNEEKEKIFTTNNIVIMIISIIISVVLSLIIIGVVNSEVKLSDFKIESFSIDTETTTYTYSDDSVTYTGNGVISCQNTTNDYMVLLEQINKTENETDYYTVIVHNGKGIFGTYDSSYSGATEKPDYEFNIIGYRSFKK